MLTPNSTTACPICHRHFIGLLCNEDRFIELQAICRKVLEDTSSYVRKGDGRRGFAQGEDRGQQLFHEHHEHHEHGELHNIIELHQQSSKRNEQCTRKSYSRWIGSESYN